MGLRIVVIGANAAGGKAASKAKRYNPEAEVILIDKGKFISYAECGIPYYVAGYPSESERLMSTSSGVIRDVNYFKAKGIRARINSEAVEIDRNRKCIDVIDTETAEKSVIPYDKLIIATGSSPSIPKVENINLKNILTVKTIEDAILLKQRALTGNHACIVGGGLIGFEMADALKSRGMSVTVVEMREQLLYGFLDPDMALLLKEHLEQQGVTIMTGSKITGFKGDSSVKEVVVNDKEIPVDLVVLGVGIRPNIELARKAGLEIGVTGAIAVDSGQCTSDPDIFACGDCCETTNLVTGKKTYIPLGTTANKQGRVTGINAAGGYATFPGIVGTGIVKVLDFNIGRTGLTETDAKANGFDIETIINKAYDKPSYFPGAKQITLKLIAEKGTGRILGLQGLGEGGVDKRIDIAATAITFGATAENLSELDLAYAPPYSTVMDSLIVAANAIKNRLIQT
ncbi:MAG: FAD-dependent oxidoreductase [Desulfuromonadales bacterium]|nr:FAD-dependent oxidoreductase [Desulfuromonadales bacterium]